MARCPFAMWRPISGPSGPYSDGPFKIVHHTTEGSKAEGAFEAFRVNRSDPHFTVDAASIYQHIDTGMAARALRNPPGGVETNRDGAIQIEVVGFAHRPKTRATLENVRRLCRWIESTHNVPRVWPNGPPKASVNARDPGGHNRNAGIWASRGGHYGHSNVPENIHWDPAYTKAEIEFLFLDDTEGLEDAGKFQTIIAADPGLEKDYSRMPNHSSPNGEGEEMPPFEAPAQRSRKFSRRRGAKSARSAPRHASSKKPRVSTPKPKKTGSETAAGQNRKRSRRPKEPARTAGRFYQRAAGSNENPA
jgi:hypothetical protein